jgi:hypothetical protein
MSTISIHGDRSPDGRSVGRPRTGRMSSRDPATAARVAKAVVQEGKWRSLPGSDDRAKILTAIGSQARWALLALTADAVDVLPALGKELPLGGCRWCAALIQRAPKPELERNEVARVLLGTPCGRCRTRHAVADEKAASLALYRELVAEGVPEGVAAAARTREAAYQAMAQIRKTEQATPPKARTSAKVLHSDGRRRVPDPPYYTRFPGR